MTTDTTAPALDLDSLVEGPEIAASYIARDFHGVSDIDLLAAAHAGDESGPFNVMMFGPTGSGKTHAVRAYAAAEGLPFYDIPGHAATNLAQHFGKWVPTADGPAWIDGVITTMLREGRGVVLLDEVSFIPPKLLGLLHMLLDSRRRIVLEDHNGEVVTTNPEGPGILIVAQHNPGYAGTNPVNAAFLNRFAMKLRYEYAADIEEALVPLPSVLRVGDQIRAMRREVRTPVSTNALVEFCTMAASFNLALAIENFVNGFAESERASIQQVMELESANIAGELAEVGA